MSTFLTIGFQWNFYQIKGQNKDIFSLVYFSFYPPKDHLAAPENSRIRREHVLRIREYSNKMTPNHHLAAGTTWKCWSLKALSNKPYPSPVNLLITSIKSQKCFQKICQLHKMYLQKHILLYRETLDIENFQFLILSA